MRHSWVEQVLGDVQFYRNNGLNLAIKDNHGSKRKLPAILQPLVPVVGAQAASKIAELPPDSQAILLEELENLPDDLELEDDSTQASIPTDIPEEQAPEADSIPRPAASHATETKTGDDASTPAKGEKAENSAPEIIDLKDL